jgi:hypothetical protein
MKKKCLTWMLLLLTLTNFGFASKKDEINSKVTNSFKKDFANASEIKRETEKAFVKLTFLLNEEVMFAYYSQNGDLLAVSRNILSNRLPLSQLIGLKKGYADYWISDLFEINAGDETAYYITLENADSTLVLKSEVNQDWAVYKKGTK